MDVFGSTDVKNLPSAILQIRSKNGLSYSSANNRQGVMDFEIPSSLGYFLGSGVNLSFDMLYSSDDGVVHPIRPQESCGLQGMIHSLRVYDFQGTLLEECVDWAILSSVFMSHAVAQDRYEKSGKAKRLGITEGYCGDYDGVIPFSTPNALPITPLDPFLPQAYQKQKIQLPLRLSNLLHADQIIPVAFLGGGLRIRILLNPIEEWCILHGDDVNTANLLVTDENPPNQFEGIFPAAGDDFVIDDSNKGNTLPASSGRWNIGTASTDYDDGGGVVNLDAAGNGLALADADMLVSLQTAATALVVWSNPSAGVMNCDNGTAGDITIDGSFFDIVTAEGAGVVIAAGANADFTLQDISWDLTTGSYTAAAAQVEINVGLQLYSPNECTDLDPTAASATGAGIIEITNNSAAVGGNTNSFIEGGFWATAVDTGALPLALPAPTVTTQYDLKSGGGSGVVGSLTLKPFYQVNNPKDLNTCPLKVGETIQVRRVVGGAWTTAWSNTSPAIDTITSDGTNIIVTFVSSWVNTGDQINDGYIKIELDPNANLQYNLTDINLQVPIVSVPAAYQVALAESVGSSEGMLIDMKSYQMVRTNAQAGQSLTSNALPFISTKAKSIISVPTVVGGATLSNRYNANNFNNLRLTKYHYEYENVRHPERSVLTDACRQGSLNQELLFESQKAFNYGMDKLENFNGWSDRYLSRTFFLGRALGAFGTTYNTINKNMNLTTESTSTAGGIETTCVLTHFSMCVNQLLINPAGVVLLR